MPILLTYLKFSNYRNLAAQNLIDSTSNLENTKVYIAHGTQDSVVKPVYGHKILEFYQGLMANSNDLVSVFNGCVPCKVAVSFRNGFTRGIQPHESQLSLINGPCRII